MTIYRVSMSYWTYWKDAYNSGYKIKEAFFSTLEKANSFCKSHEHYFVGFAGEGQTDDPEQMPEFYIDEILLDSVK